jgi:enamine deaminase RidA (YjgF/YER057c/UK114 family)
MTRVEYLHPPGLGTPVGLYSHVSRDNESGLVFVAGQVATGADGAFVGAGSFTAQMRQVFENVGLALRGAGASYESVLKLTTYLVRREDLPAFREVRDELFSVAYPDRRYPPHTLCVVPFLSDVDHLIEMDAVAAIVQFPSSRR